MPSNDGTPDAKIAARGVDVFYSGKQALFEIDLEIGSRAVLRRSSARRVAASRHFFGMNRMNDVIDGCEVIGSIELDGQNIYSRGRGCRSAPGNGRNGVSKPNPFPKSIYDNVAYGPRIHGLVSGSTETDEIVEQSLRRAGLWEEVKERLQEPGTGLSGSQQQRLCIARAIAVSPQVILMDEPCSALDPIATARIEELIDELRENFTIVIVTHSMQQAARVSQRTAFFHLGNLVEVGDTEQIFTNPREQRTQDYITGRFG